MKTNHVVQNFRINSFDNHVGLELALSGAHAERPIVTSSYIFSVVQPASRAIAAETNLLIALLKGSLQPYKADRQHLDASEFGGELATHPAGCKQWPFR